MSIGSLILGINEETILQKAVQMSITAEKPAQIPKLNGIAPLSPFRLPFDIDMMLFGPGVTAVTTAYVRNETQLNIIDILSRA